MDYNFNMKSSHRKFKMSPFLPSGLERCFSTSSRVNVNPCMANKLEVNPFLNFISGLHSQANSCNKKSTGNIPTGAFTTSGMSVSSLPSGPFTAGMSVSCIVGGFVGSDNPIRETQEYCDNLLLDVLLNECLPFDSTAQTNSTQNNPETMKAEPIQKRTYAEVTKEKPRPRKPFSCTRSSSTPSAFLENSISIMNSIKRNAKSCDNFPILHQSHSVKLTTINSDVPDRVLNIQKVSSETLFSPQFTRLKTYSSSSDSSFECEKSVCRTMSESSAESDDSFIVFQHDDGTVDDYSEEECSDEDEEEEENLDEVPVSLSCSEKESSFCEANISDRKDKKVVRWATNLVKVHPLRMWDFASRAARPGPWEQLRRDRERFQRRIRDVSSVLSPVLDPAHRLAVFESRFKPS